MYSVITFKFTQVFVGHISKLETYVRKLLNFHQTIRQCPKKTCFVIQFPFINLTLLSESWQGILRYIVCNVLDMAKR